MVSLNDQFQQQNYNQGLVTSRTKCSGHQNDVGNLEATSFQEEQRLKEGVIPPGQKRVWLMTNSYKFIERLEKGCREKNSDNSEKEALEAGGYQNMTLTCNQFISPGLLKAMLICCDLL